MEQEGDESWVQRPGPRLANQPHQHLHQLSVYLHLILGGVIMIM